MLKKPLLITTLLVLFALLFSADQAQAGKYTLVGCHSGSGTQSSYFNGFALGSGWNVTNGPSCTEGYGLLSMQWNSLNTIPTGSFTQGAAGFDINAPSGTKITGISWKWYLSASGYGVRCLRAVANWQYYGGDCYDGGATGTGGTKYPSPYPSAWKTSADKFAPADTVRLQLSCAGGTCSRYSGESNNLGATIQDILVELSDDTAPGLTSGAGVWGKSGWVRGSWPLSWDGSDNMGVKQHRYSVDNQPGQVGNAFCNVGSYLGIYLGASPQPCPNPGQSGYQGAAFTVDTRGYSDGTHKLQLQTVDSTDNVGTAETDIKVDNSAPVVSAVTTNSANTDNTPTLTIAASDPQSGISGYLCKVDWSAYVSCDKSFDTPPLALGSHNVCVKALNNSENTNGQVDQSSELCRTVEIAPQAVPPSGNQPTPPTNPTTPSNPTTPMTPTTPTNPTTPGAPDKDSNPDDGLKLKNYRVISTKKATVLRTLVSVDRGGQLTQTVVHKYGNHYSKKGTTGCSVTRAVSKSDSVLLECRLRVGTHKTLAKRGMTVYLTTTLDGSDGNRSREVDQINLAKRK